MENTFVFRIAEDYAIVELSLEHLPTERFKRNVVRGKLDLVGEFASGGKYCFKFLQIALN